MFFWKLIYRKKPSWIISFSAYLWHLIFVLVIEIVSISSSEKELVRSSEALGSLKMELWDTSLFLVHTRSWFDFEKVFFCSVFSFGTESSRAMEETILIPHYHFHLLTSSFLTRSPAQDSTRSSFFLSRSWQLHVQS